MSKKLLTYIRPKIRLHRDLSYEVVYVDEFSDPKVVGESRPSTFQIVLKNGQSNTELFKTYLHECLHAISDEHDIGLTEKQVGKLEEAIYRFLRLNNYL